MELRLRGGIGKAPLVQGGKAIDAELERIKPLLGCKLLKVVEAIGRSWAGRPTRVGFAGTIIGTYCAITTRI